MTYGFIGAGNMGGALATAVCKKEGGNRVVIARKNREKLAAQTFQLRCCHGSVEEVAKSAKFIFLGVKPQVMPVVLEEIAPILKERTDRFVLVSMAAGLSTERIASMAGGDYPVIRLMPNTPVSVGAGMTLYCRNSLVDDQELETCLHALSLSGQLDDLPEHLFDVGTAVAGCGPAFVDLFLEALADGGVACGLPRDKAMAYAVQMVMGSAQLAKESGAHPGVLKDAVCSPGGSTIQGVRALEMGGFRGTIMDAVVRAYEKTQNLGK
ncbi:MAG: pyrroline-5-carboxylate reductase [Eubacteriales bacterium]